MIHLTDTDEGVENVVENILVEEEVAVVDKVVVIVVENVVENVLVAVVDNVVDNSRVVDMTVQITAPTVNVNVLAGQVVQLS